MTYLSLFEKFKILFELLIETKYILIFLGLITILTVIYLIKKISGKKYLLLLIISLILVFIICIVKNYKVLSSTFNNFTTLFFTNIYFPSIYVYIVIIITSLILFITSIINKNKRRINKIMDITFFIINSLLLIVILNIIAKNNVDIFSVASLYTNKSLVAILEINMGVFVIWILTHIITYITNSICETKKVVYVASKLGIKNNKIRIRDNKLLLKKNKRLIKENKWLLESKIKLAEENKVLSENNNKLNETNKLLYQNNIRINEEKNILIIDKNKLSEENKILLEDSVKVKEENILLINNNNKLIEENSILVNNNNKLSKENKKLLENNNLVISNNMLLEEIKVTKEKEIQPTYSVNVNVFNDILNGTLAATYYETNITSDKQHEIVNPQEIYEGKYNIAVEEYQKNNATLEKKAVLEEVFNEEISKEDNVILNNDAIVENESVLEEKIERIIAEDKLPVNTITIKEPSKEEIISEIAKEDTIALKEKSTLTIEEKTKDIYTLEDYKQIIKMLNNLKSHSKNSNINIDEAVTISLINNYSIDDCLKFKEILESNLN